MHVVGCIPFMSVYSQGKASWYFYKIWTNLVSCGFSNLESMFISFLGKISIVLRRDLETKFKGNASWKDKFNRLIFRILGNIGLKDSLN